MPEPALDWVAQLLLELSTNVQECRRAGTAIEVLVGAAHGQIDTEAVIDPVKDHYEVMHVGWDRRRRVHGCVVHIDIRAGKVWVQYDGTSLPVAEELAAAGIPREDIVLAFHPAELRQHTGFAAG